MKDSSRNTIRFITLSGLFIAIGIVLPIAFHAIPEGGKIFLPMTLPILLGALFLPWQFALLVGIITPLLSSLLTGMPPMAPLPMNIIMAAEYGVAAATISLINKTKWVSKKGFMVLFALIPGIIIGKIVGGSVLKIAIQFFGVKGPDMWTFILGAFVTGLPGIAMQVVLIPILYVLLKRQSKQMIE